MKRRTALTAALVNGCGSYSAFAEPTRTNLTADEWISETLQIRASESPLQLARFREPIWVLLKPITWRPSNEHQKIVPPITVPKNFVTDLASIPRIFWSLVPRDGQYAYSAIVHDFLYWSQHLPRDQADQVFKWSMEDLEVSPAEVAAIYTAVRSMGGDAWKSNASAKLRGERRILKKPPPKATTRWADWKTNAEHFI